jgi:hypothetical protein
LPGIVPAIATFGSRRNEQACVRLVSTLMMELNQEWMERLYLRMEQLTNAATS